ncbi:MULTISPECIES: hypothetical protein [Bradyrhizobium]|jgi:hypothetical protein|nr:MULTISPECIES: hypothetical protein [unclassified Bradyrhizobium]MDU1545774.1 hypothetical protein [Bradyrhizobium sp.]MDU3094766.1 hypothetical protein [Bradyrhizobium sp.]MDU3227048.1 hypothetical protein [Bradyrhizobium sp.]MDU6068713.1 hypothetical protein [Bradyrhizobium sp.]MDU6189638.1 hypothetical protein [Bradyrhizobium sp.]
MGQASFLTSKVEVPKRTANIVIVFANEICYPDDMGRRFGQKLPRMQAPGLRRTLLIFLAFSYLFVGLVHTISCTDEAVAAAISSDSGNMPDDGPDEGGKKSPVLAGHCYVCAPVMMPALVTDAGPSTRPVTLYFAPPKLQFEDHPRLDTPPPKHLA